MSARIITGMIPPGGWHFMQEGKFRVEANSYGELIKAVIDWRLQNNRSVGDAKNEIDDYICNSFPRQCQGGRPTSSQPKQPYQQPSVARFIDRIIAWAVDTMNAGNAKDLETEQEAGRRAAVCSECPKNTTWENSCPACVDHAQRLLTIIRQGKDIQSLAPKLHACGELNHDNRTAIWIKKQFLRQSPNLPSQCWLK